MSDVDKLIELAKKGPLRYEEAMSMVQAECLDCAPSSILEVCCLSRDWDCGALTYLCGIITAEIRADKAMVVRRYGSRAPDFRDSSKDPGGWQQHPFKLLAKSLK